VFLDTVSAEQTELELAFLERQLPHPRYARVLDLFCGSGRHALPLAARGYAVTGVDRNAAMVMRAREAGVAGALFVGGDVRKAGGLSGPWDAALMMWSSFGQFTAEQNTRFLEDVRQWLRPKGRLVMDVYDRRFFEDRQGERVLERGGVQVVERKWLDGDRLHVELDYGDGGEPDRLDWQVFTADTFARYVTGCGFDVCLACTEFNESRAAAGDRPRMQWVLERPV
jgi:SAM-dependent methyltransferase